MAFSSKNYRTVRERFETKKSMAEAKAASELAVLHSDIPELAEIDEKLSGTALDIFGAATSGGDVEKKLEEIRARHAELTERRRALLDKLGIPENAGEPVYDCPVCRDTGFAGGKMCSCLKKAIVEETLVTSGLGGLVKTQSFDSFSVEYYKDDPLAFQAANDALYRCRSFAESFDPESGKNLLLIGATGLGKTHLSTSVAKTVIERGFDVVYETAQNIFRDFGKQQFGRRDSDVEDETARYFDCDLLIIDDLGTELTNNFTVACLYNIIYTRLNGKKPMIINTNLAQKELRQRYEDRITSRLFGEFDPLFFTGKDVRSRKQ